MTPELNVFTPAGVTAAASHDAEGGEGVYSRGPGVVCPIWLLVPAEKVGSRGCPPGNLVIGQLSGERRRGALSIRFASAGDIFSENWMV